MTHLDLFAGAGGASWFGKLIGARCVGYVENDEYCKQVIRARIKDGIFDDAPIFSDVRTFNGLPYRGRVDLITAGFPCQPFSVAGKRKGESDERNMWPDTLRILGEIRPRFAILENVPGLFATDYIRTIFGGLAASGFDAEWQVISASDVGAPHLRKRVWIFVTDAQRHGGRPDAARHRLSAESTELQFSDGEARSNNAAPICSDVADADRNRREERQVERFRQRKDRSFKTGQPNTWSDYRTRTWWKSEPGLGRVADGVANRSNRLKALGNGWVPGVAYEFWRRVI